MKKKLFKLNVKNTVLFLYTGLCLVFPLGLLTLTIGPVRMISDLAENRNWTEQSENLIQKIALVCFLIVILLLTIKLTRYLSNKFNYNTKTKFAILTILGIGLIISVYIFSFKPEMLINTNAISHVNKSADAEFHFGAYPDEEKMKELKAQNYTAVISLLHSLVIPAEPILMEKEAEYAKKTGMKLISIPMLPWIVENDSSVIKIKNIARNFKGKYYVHCYLGKDRANVFRNIIEKENNKIQFKSELGTRNLDTIKSFERGTVFKLKHNAYLTPFPTDEEFFSFILNGKIQTVVSLMDPKNKEEKLKIEKEQKIMKQYNQQFLNVPLTETDSEEKIEETVEQILKLKQPIVIHGYSTNTESIKKFISLYNSKAKK